MKLIAVKRISERRPVGCVFEEPNPRAKMLVAIGLAKAYVEPVADVVPPVEMYEAAETTDGHEYVFAAPVRRRRGSRHA